MGFENFGTVSFTAEAKAADFITHLEAGKVMPPGVKNVGVVTSHPRRIAPGACPAMWSGLRSKARVSC